MLQLLFDLRDAVRKEFVDGLLRLHPGKACNKLAECSHCVGLGIGCDVVVYQFEDQVEQRIREMQADNIQHPLDGAQHSLFLLASRRAFLPTFLR